ncbi:RluA family pseudouridine synthase [Aquisalimonas asiatica]|uniref:Pseudouridine synthase n=1 Tax=Aquisalimonas asiatica TaxID=406100 RepID=A0A1H8QEI6_9GAMM|nr:RluA family pseudouridine synthase [Aquisalimonas asiatica]SEO52645.1 ribosomal large subunit pseudouridine synthase C [Aquisalimonas asiatica]
MTSSSRSQGRNGVRHVDVDSGSAGQRIDNFLARELKGVPRSRVHRLLRKGEVRVNGGRVRSGARLAAGDRVRIPPVAVDSVDPASGGEPPKGMQERIRDAVLHEDDRLLVLNKPSGIAVHGGSGVPWGVIETLRAIRPGTAFLELVHRLDRETSGCLLVAKRRSTLRTLHEVIRAGALEKRYLALVKGRLPKHPLPVEARLDRNARRDGERTVQVSAEGQAARSVFRRSEVFREATLAEVSIATGRTHQIRVHGAHAGHPVAGDGRYGDQEWNKALRGLGLKRLFLHASGLRWTDPDNGAEHVYHAALPDELRAVLDELESVAR